VEREIERLEKPKKSQASRLVKLETRPEKLKSQCAGPRQELDRPEYRMVRQLTQQFQRLPWRRPRR
jgi:hypothetical protein